MGKNVFQKIESNEKLPNHVKKETLGSLFSMKMLADFIDLFVVKAGATFTSSVDRGQSIKD